MGLSVVSLFFLFVLSSSYLNDLEKNALYDIYNGLNGDHWTNCRWNMTYIMDQTENDLLPLDYCGILTSRVDGIFNKLQTVIGFSFLQYNNLYGTISSSIGNLTNLRRIHISNNPQITGTIPHDICNLNQLNSIEIHNTSLYGHIPLCLGENKLLQQFDISYSPNLTMNTTNIERMCMETNFS